MTKTQMAQIIVQALRGYESIPRPDCARVRNMARLKKDHLAQYYPLALKSIAKREKENRHYSKEWKDEMIQDQGLPVGDE